MNHFECLWWLWMWMWMWVWMWMCRVDSEFVEREVNGNRVKLELYDTAGQEVYKSLARGELPHPLSSHLISSHIISSPSSSPSPSLSHLYPISISSPPSPPRVLSINTCHHPCLRCGGEELSGRRVPDVVPRGEELCRQGHVGHGHWSKVWFRTRCECWSSDKGGGKGD